MVVRHPAPLLCLTHTADRCAPAACPPGCREGGAWRQGDKPQFDVQHLQYKLKGNNVPMPSTLVKHLLRVFIPEIIQVGPHTPRRLGRGHPGSRRLAPAGAASACPPGMMREY